MTDTTDFFDNVGGGAGAPSPVLKNPGDWVNGEIVEMYKRDYIPYENRKSREPARNPDGSAKQQLVIVIQTTHRNWENVSKVPKVDPADENSAEKPPSEDDGKRAIFVPEGKNIHFAIGRAVTAAGEKPRVGGTLGVRVVNLKDVGKGEPLKEHEARYVPPSAASGFFQGDQAAPQAPAPQPAPQAPPAPAPQAPQAQPAPAPQAPAAQDPWAASPAPQQAAPAAQDPWATSAPAQQDGPPF